jgi:hypothetical protein
MNWTNSLGGGGSNEQGQSYFLDLATGSSESVLEKTGQISTSVHNGQCSEFFCFDI